MADTNKSIVKFPIPSRNTEDVTPPQALDGLKGVGLAIAAGATAESIAAGVRAAFNAPQSAGQLMAKLENDTTDANVFVSSDSTGNATNEWVYLYAGRLAALRPSYSVNYYQWNDATDSYNAAAVVQVGTGTNTLNVWNGAVSGTKPAYLMGSKFDAAVRDIPSCDLIIMNHGHNMVNSYPDTELGSDKGRVPLFLESIAKMLQRHTGAGLLMLTQNPRRDDDEMVWPYVSIIKTAGLTGADIADSYTLFLDAGRDPALYADNIHPSDDGSQLYLSAVMGKHTSLAAKAAVASELTKNYLIGGDFATLGGDNIPEGFTISEEASSTVDSATFDNLNGYSLALTMDSSNGGAHLRKALTAAELGTLRGHWVTLSVRVLIGEGQTSTACRPYIDTNVADTDVSYTQTADGQGDWVWRSVSTYVDPSVAFAFVGVLIDTSGTVGATFNVSDMVLSKGKLIGI